jgi:hypothetical protein
MNILIYGVEQHHMEIFRIQMMNILMLFQMKNKLKLKKN